MPRDEYSLSLSSSVPILKGEVMSNPFNIINIEKACLLTLEDHRRQRENFGYSGSELGFPTIKEHQVYQSQAIARKVRDILGMGGTNTCHLPMKRINEPTQWRRRNRMKTITDAIYFCHEMEITQVVLHPVNTNDREYFETRLRSLVQTQAEAEAIALFALPEIIEVAEECGITVCLENQTFHEPGFWDFSKLITLCKKYGNILGICADLLHAASCQMDIINELSKLPPYLKEIHITQGNYPLHRGDEVRHDYIGWDGIVPIRKCRQTWERIGFNGPKVVEVESEQDAYLSATRLGLLTD